MIQQPDGTNAYLPIWMTKENANHCKISSKPILPIKILKLLNHNTKEIINSFHINENNKPGVKYGKTANVISGRNEQASSTNNKSDKTTACKLDTNNMEKNKEVRKGRGR